MGMEPTETILIVDDEEPVRKTFREWLDGARLGCRILTAPDAETALKQANDHMIDSWPFSIGLWGPATMACSCFQDLSEFNKDIVAIMVTGFANKATPLDAMPWGYAITSTRTRT